MQVNDWQLVIYKARTPEVRDSLSSDARASRLKALDFELRSSPFGPTCWGMNLSTVRGPDLLPVSAALLDTVKLFLNGQPDPVYTGRVSKLPGLGVAEDQFEVQGHYRLAKVVFAQVPIKDYSGQFWPKVREVLEGKLGAGNVLVPDDPSVTVQNWTVEDKNVKLDALARRFSDLLGGGLAFGFRADGKFVIGRRPLEPTRTLGLGTFEAREAPLANRLYVGTGYEPVSLIVLEETASLERDGPLEEAEDLSGLVQRSALGLTQNRVNTYDRYTFTAGPLGPDGYAEFDYAAPQTPALGEGVLKELHFFDYVPGDGNFTPAGRGPGSPGHLDMVTLTPVPGAGEGEWVYPPVTRHIVKPLRPGVTAVIVHDALAPSNVPGYEMGTLTGVLISMAQIRDHANNLFVEKYGPTLRATATLTDLFVAPGGRGRYRYGDGEDVLLIDYSGKYTLADGRFQTVITGGSKSRYNAAQQSRLTSEDLSRRISRLEAP